MPAAAVGIHLARHWFGLGHAVFSNASCLFGWHLEHEEMSTAMEFMPKNSVLLIDESSAHLASRVGHRVAISSFSEMNLKYEEAEGERPTGQNGSPQDSQTERAHALLGFLQAHESAPPKFFRRPTLPRDAREFRDGREDRLGVDTGQPDQPQGLPLGRDL